MAKKSISHHDAFVARGHDYVKSVLKAARPSRAFLVKAAKKRSTPKRHAPDEKSQKLVQSILKAAVPLREFLADADKKQLKQEQHTLLVDQAILILEGFYVHLPMKRARYAVDPVQRLRLLRQRLSSIKSDLHFHAEMIDIFASLRDVHTGYMLPEPFAPAVAILPFRVESYFAGKKRKYLVTSIVPGFDQGTFKVGVEVLSWNGVPIARAAEAAGASSSGGNDEARHAKGLARLTTCALIRMPPPDEEWVRVGYRDHDGRPGEVRFDWKVIKKSEYIKIEPSTMSLEVDLVRQVRTLLFKPEFADPDDNRVIGVFDRKMINTPHGRVGYIRIFTFNLKPDKFFDEFKNRLKGLPKNGLIIDVRDNGGGHTAAGERVLQLLGKTRPIEPQRLYLINTPRTLEICQRQKANTGFGPNGLKPWLASLERSAETGGLFSASFPYTDPELCNKSKPSYTGPVVVITNALSYSTTEFFAAGVQDHGLGLILGTDKCTGGGGANVRTHEQLWESFGGDENRDSPFKEPPNGAGFTVAFRRSQRVRAQAGNEVEGFGVESEDFHRMTRRDLLEGNADLIDHAATLLAGMRRHSKPARGPGRGSKKAGSVRPQAQKSRSRRKRPAA
jgi:C-terminal processing protease CtpA/Prc